MHFRNGKPPLCASVFCVLGMALWTGCSSKPVASALPPQPVVKAPTAQKGCRTWRVFLDANLSHLSITPRGSRVLSSTSSEKVKGPNKKESRIRLFNGYGKTLWSYWLPHPVKSQALSKDGDLVAISTYDDKLEVLSIDGRKLWERQHLGRPAILSKPKRILLLNDDDSDPHTAFVVYDYKGTLLAEVRLGKSKEDWIEPIDMFIADSEDRVLVSAPDGEVHVFDLDGKRVWKEDVTGEVVSAALDTERAWVLSAKKDDQRLTAFKQGKELWSVALDRQYESVRFAANTVFLYGNLQGSQTVAAYRLEDGKELWRRSYPLPANYSSLFFSFEGENYVTAALDTGQVDGVLNIFALNAAGEAIWDIPVRANNGIYSYAVAPIKRALAVASGEPNKSVVEFYQVGCR